MCIYVYIYIYIYIIDIHKHMFFLLFIRWSCFAYCNYFLSSSVLQLLVLSMIAVSAAPSVLVKLRFWVSVLQSRCASRL